MSFIETEEVAAEQEEVKEEKVEQPEEEEEEVKTNPDLVVDKWGKEWRKADNYGNLYDDYGNKATLENGNIVPVKEEETE